MIGTIQALRAFAAIAVLVFHAQLLIFGVQTEFAAVPLFFCISGFIMTMISRSRPENFFFRRFIRVVPLYWLLTVLFWGMVSIGTGVLTSLINSSGNPTAVVRSLAVAVYTADYPRLLWSLAFSGQPDGEGHVYPVMQVGWTLNLELFFYSTFAIWLKLTHRLAPLLTCATLLVVCGIMQIVDWPERVEFYGSSMMLYFVLGVIVFYVSQALQRYQLGLKPLLIVTVIIAYVYIGRYWIELFSGPILAYLLPALVVLIAVLLHRSGWHVKSPTMLLLGAASFSIYIVQEFVLIVMWFVASRYPELSPRAPNIAVSLVVVAVGIALGIITHKVLELPLLNYLQRKISPEKTLNLPADNISRA